MSRPVSTSGAVIDSTQLKVKREERFTVALQVQPITGLSFTGATATAQLRRADGLLICDFGTSPVSVGTDGVATFTFDAATATTSTWPTGVYWFDAAWKIGSTYGPKRTQTYKVTVYEGPTQATA